MNDAEIVGRVLSGETGRFEALVDRYLPLVRGLCAGRVADASARDDLIQESFVQAYLQLDRLRDRNRFPAWLARIAVNKCREWLRGQGRRGRMFERLAVEAPAGPPDPADEATRHEMHEWVRSQIAKLPEKTRDAMMLCYVEGLSIGEAARSLGVRESAVKKRLQYGREAVGARLLDRFGEAGERQDSAALRNRVLSAVPFAAAPWKEPAAVAAVAGAGAWLAAKAALVAVPLIAAAAGVGVWMQLREPASVERPAGAVAPAVAEAAPETVGDPADDALAEDAVPVALTVRFAASNVAPGNEPPAANVRLRLEPEALSDGEALSAMLREAGALEDWTKLWVAFDETLRSGGKKPRADAASFQKDVDAKVEALKARLGPAEMKRRFGTWAYPLRSLEFVTDGAGRAEVRLRPGRYRARLLWEADDVYGISEEPLPELTVSQEGPREAVLRVRDILSAICGRAVDANSGGEAFAAHVDLSGDAGTGQCIVAGNEGRFWFDPLATGYGAFELRVTSNEHLPAVVQGVREPGKPMELEIRLQPRGKVSGRVTDASGRPLPGVKIFRSDITGSSASSGAETDASGEYALKHDGGAVRLYAAGVSVKTDKVTLNLRPDESINQDFVMPPAARAVFDIRKPDGTVPEELKEQQLAWPGVSHSGRVLVREGKRYVINYLSPGTYELAFLVEGCEGESLNFTVSDGLTDVQRSIRLRPARLSARVRVVDAQGRPKPGARVGALRKEAEQFDENGGSSQGMSSVGYDQTDAAGEVAFSGLPAGDYSFYCEGVEVEAVLPAKETIVVEVPDRPAEEPLHGLFVSKENLQPVDAARGDLRLPADGLELMALTPSNRLTTGFVEPGENLLFVFKSGYPTAVLPVTVTEEMIGVPGTKQKPAFGPLEVRFEKGGGLSGVVRDEAGQPVADTQVRVYPAELESRYDPEAEQDPRLANMPVDDMWSHLGDLFAQGARTGDDGSFRVEFLPPGRYLVRVGDTVTNFGAPVEVRAGMETGPVDLVK